MKFFKKQQNRERRQKGWTKHHQDESWKAIRDYGSLKREVEQARKVLLKAEKEYDAALYNLAEVEQKLADEARTIVTFEEVLVTSMRDVNIVQEMVADYEFTGTVKVARNKYQDRMTAELQRAHIHCILLTS